MPELPEVEMQRIYLARTSLNKKINRVEIIDDYVIKTFSPNEFINRLEGSRFEKVRRCGKFLEVYTSSEFDLAIHFGMTGYLKYVPTHFTRHKHARVIFTFMDYSELRYLAKRKLGGLYLVPKGEFTQINTIRKMGPEPLSPDFDLSKFKYITRRRSAMIKILLLDQSYIAGIGNIYSDEILFQAGIRPDRKVTNLTEHDLSVLFTQIRRVLNTAIQRATSFRGLENSFLITHRSKGETCPRCKSLLKKMKISNRTSYYCENCQN